MRVRHQAAHGQAISGVRNVGPLLLIVDRMISLYCTECSNLTEPRDAPMELEKIRISNEFGQSVAFHGVGSSIRPIPLKVLDAVGPYSLRPQRVLFHIILCCGIAGLSRGPIKAGGVADD